MKDNFDIFFRRKPAMMLVSLKKNTRMRYGSILAKEVDCTYSHAVKILQILEELKLVEFEKKGRIKLIKLTKKGRDVAEAIENIQDLIKWAGFYRPWKRNIKIFVNRRIFFLFSFTLSNIVNCIYSTLIIFKSSFSHLKIC